MATSALDYTRYLMKTAYDKLNLGKNSEWFLEEMLGFDSRFASDIIVKLADPHYPGKRIPRSFPLVRVNHRSPHKSYIFGGGWRYHEDVKLSTMENLAAEMSIKFWHHGIPESGAKGGIAFDPTKYSEDDCQDITNKAIEKLVERGIIGPFKDRLAPDVGTGPKIMDWICEHYGYIMELAGRKDPFYEGIATGKPGTNGIPFRKKATGVGMHYALNTFQKYGDIVLPDRPKVIINGFGNVASNFALNADISNVDIIGVADLDQHKIFGGVYQPDGIPIQELARYVEAHKTVQGFENECGGTRIREKFEFFTLPTDIFVPAAMEGDITEKEAPYMKCKFVLEGGNSTTTREADEDFQARGIPRGPDVHMNSAAGLVSYYEHAYAIETTNKHPEVPIPPRYDDSVQEAVQRQMSQAGRNVIKMAKEYHVPYRLAVYMLAFYKVYPLFVAKRRMNGVS